MTLQQVLDFLCIAEHGSVHAASRASGQSQPALTKSLHRLEQTLGAPLFDRHAKGTRINAFGREFLDHARRITAEAQRAREAMAQSLGQRHGRVEYGISAAASLLLAPSAIRRFRHEFPEVEISSRSGLYHSLMPLLRDGQIDFAICPMPPHAIDAQLSSNVLLQSQMVLVARRHHPLAQARRLAQVREASFVVGGPAGMPGGGLYTVFEHAGWGTPRVDLRTDNPIDTAALVSGSDCLALLPEALLQSGLLRERLVAVPIDETLPAYAVALFQRAEVALTSAARSLAVQFEREAHYRSAQGPGNAPPTAPFTSTA